MSSLNPIFVNVGWARGNILFEKKKKILVTNGTNERLLKAAVEFKRQTAERVAKTHFGQPAETVVGQLYFEIFDSKEDGVAAIFRSENAPEE